MTGGGSLRGSYGNSPIRFGCLKTLKKSPRKVFGTYVSRSPISHLVWRSARAGTSTSARTCPKYVAFAMTSTSPNREEDWIGMLRNASQRCRRQGEAMSARGTAKIVFQPRRIRFRLSFPAIDVRRVPRTWSTKSIAWSIGER